MKNIYFILIPCFCFSQIGINNSTPQATLDIKTINNQSSIIIENNKAEKQVELDQNGNFIFNGALQIYDKNSNTMNPGRVGQVLVSNGPNMVPSWVDINKSVISNYVLPVLYYKTNKNSSNVYKYISNIEYPISFALNEGKENTLYLVASYDPDLDPDGSGVNEANQVEVVKDGVYEVVINGKIFLNNISAPNISNSFMKLYLNDYVQFEKGETNLNEAQFIVKASRFLNKGDMIYAMIESPSNWNIKEMVAFITYVEKDN